MSPALRIRLLLCLTLPALLLPRGLELGWCLCDVPDGVTCCVPATAAPAAVPSCCGVGDSHAGETSQRAEPEQDLDCPGCRSIEVESFEEFLLVSTAPEPLAPAPAAVFAADDATLGAARRAPFAPRRAPPGAVPPPGLLPGTAPLRI